MVFPRIPKYFQEKFWFSTANEIIFKNNKITSIEKKSNNFIHYSEQKTEKNTSKTILNSEFWIHFHNHFAFHFKTIITKKGKQFPILRTEKMAEAHKKAYQTRQSKAVFLGFPSEKKKERKIVEHYYFQWIFVCPSLVLSKFEIQKSQNLWNAE